jgi:putative iron-dependent peroxidase
MLENMFVGKPPGNYDRLLDFSRAVTGTLFFVPTATFLEDVAADAAVSSSGEPASNSPESEAKSEPPPSPSDGSLGIGSLKKERGQG